MVSEIMLQQTQTERTREKYLAFIKVFPTVKKLSSAPRSDVLRMWQGLGYNRRALLLKQSAEMVINTYQGKIPSEYEELQQLPGIGPYTAGAILAFAFNKPHVLIETNIRSVFLHHFFQKNKKISDGELIPLIKATLSQKKPREWYQALMDYGSYLKKMVPNPNRRSSHYVRQAPFKGSRRELRGVLLKQIINNRSCSLSNLSKLLQRTKDEILPLLAGLEKEGFIEKKNGSYRLKN